MSSEVKGTNHKVIKIINALENEPKIFIKHHLEMEETSDVESFLTWEKMCENSLVDENADKESTRGAQADDEKEVSTASINESIKKKYLQAVPQTDQSSPQRGSCNYITNLLDPNSAIVELNDTLDAVNYILRGAYDDDDEEDIQHLSSITVSSDGSSSSSMEVKSLEDETEPTWHDTLAATTTIDEKIMSNSQTNENEKQPRKTGECG